MEDKPRFEFNKAHLYAEWNWNIHNDICPICRNNIIDPSIQCEANKFDISTCIGVTGECGHAFHYDCITIWLKTRNVCPLDNKPWVFQKKNNTENNTE